MKKKICAVSKPTAKHHIALRPIPETELEKEAIALIQRGFINAEQFNPLAASLAKHVPILQWVVNFLDNSTVQTIAAGDARKGALAARRKCNLVFLFERTIMAYSDDVLAKARVSPEIGFIAFRDLFSALLHFYSHNKCSHKQLLSDKNHVPFFIERTQAFWELFHAAKPSSAEVKQLSKADKGFLKKSLSVLFDKKYINAGTPLDKTFFTRVLVPVTAYFPDFDLMSAIPDLASRFGVSWTPLEDPVKEMDRLDRLVSYSFILASTPSGKQKAGHLDFLKKYIQHLAHFEGKVPTDDYLYALSFRIVLAFLSDVSVDKDKSLDWHTQFELLSNILPCLIDLSDRSRACFMPLIQTFLHLSTMFFLERFEGVDGYAEFLSESLPLIKTKLKQVDGKPDALGLYILRAASLWTDVLAFVSKVHLSYQDMDVPKMMDELGVLEKRIEDADVSKALLIATSIFQNRYDAFLRHRTNDKPEIEMMKGFFSLMPGYPKPIFRFRMPLAKMMVTREISAAPDDADRMPALLKQMLYYSAFDIVLKDEDGAGLAKLMVYMSLKKESQVNHALLPFFSLSLDVPESVSDEWQPFILNSLKREMKPNMLKGLKSAAESLPPELAGLFNAFFESKNTFFRFSPDLPDEATVREVLNGDLVTAEGPVVFGWNDTEFHQMLPFLDEAHASSVSGEDSSINDTLLQSTILMTTKLETLLHFAAKARDRDAMLKLVRLGYSLDWEDRSGQNAYTHAPDEAVWVCQKMLEPNPEAMPDSGAAAEAVPDSPEVQLKNLRKNRKLMKGLLEMGFSPLSAKRGKGSHRLLRNEKGETITVPNHGEIKPGTLGSILNKAKG